MLALGLQLAAAQGGMPPSSNPYAGKSYGGCAGGFCESADPALELQFWEAASKGDAKTVKQLLGNEKLNLTRNIVPDDDGLSRVLDVAVWVAAEKGRHEVMRVRLPRVMASWGLWVCQSPHHAYDRCLPTPGAAVGRTAAFVRGNTLHCHGTRDDAHTQEQLALQSHHHYHQHHRDEPLLVCHAPSLRPCWSTLATCGCTSLRTATSWTRQP